MTRQDCGRTCGKAIVECRGVIGPHRELIIGPIVIYQHHTLDGITRLIQLLENGYQRLTHRLMTHHLTQADIPLGIVVQKFQVAQRVEWQGAIIFIGAALHASKNLLRDRLGTPEVLLTEDFYAFSRYYLLGTPLPEGFHLALITLWSGQ